MTVYRVAITTFFCFMILGCNGDPTAGLPVWEPNPSQLDKLDVSADLGLGDVMQPPKGYRKETATQGGTKGNADGVIWTSERRDDGTAHVIMVQRIKPPTGETIPDLATTLKKLMVGVQRTRTNFELQDPEFGVINGIKFGRQSWTGREPKSKLEMEGTMWVGIRNDWVIQLMTQDGKPYCAETFPLGEASLLTFKKRD